MRKNLTALIVAAVSAAVISVVLTVAIAQTRTYTFNGLIYSFPSAQGTANFALTNDGTGTLTWAATIPADLVGFMNGDCPTGWTEYTTAGARYVVGLVASGTSTATVGTVLSVDENRAVGQHNHTGDIAVTPSDAGHSHGITEPNAGTGHNHTIGTAGGDGDDEGSARRNIEGSQASSSATTGVNPDPGAPGLSAASSTTTINNEGGVVGTNAPYLVLRPCEKD